ncbi:MAG: TetR family transcriptional regulator, partial [Proteobacteria bacterium]|nr:TetR family transcriptional regulator [Pseudomonadota bacterium]
AEIAGVSIGSLYQYFPNKDAMIVALHRRHAQQMHAVMTAALEGSRHGSLRASLGTLARALLAAHLVEPALHQVLERQFSFFDEPKDLAGPYAVVTARVRALLEQHRDELVPQDLDLATYMVLRTLEALVHAAVLEPPPGVSLAALEGSITDVLVRYLAGRTPR